MTKSCWALVVVFPSSELLSCEEVDDRRAPGDGGRHKISLSPKEFTLLVYFAERQNHVLTSNQILEAVWGAEYVDSPHLVATVISRLRQKLDPVSGAPVIHAVPSLGYRFTAVMETEGHHDDRRSQAVIAPPRRTG